VPTLACFHAHPDDEAIATGGTMALAADAGLDVVLIVATGGEHGEPQPGVLDHGEELGDRRVTEVREAGAILGASRVELLDYLDSGMMGEPTNENPESFWRADVDDAAGQVAALLTEVGADIFTIYDSHGGYGHPDHIQVHRVGLAAATLAGVSQVYEATMNRTRIMRQFVERADELAAAGIDPPEVSEAETFGTEERFLTHAVDVRSVIDRKKAAMKAHASQIGPESFFMQFPEDAFADAFGIEFYIRHGHVRDGAPMAGSLW
jgi:LmbE family N-acetylglucosaminyl deacetylase